MKKFFKILRKIVKILLKFILWLILGIIVIVSIGLMFINNKTLKFYKNENGNVRFTMNKNFKFKDLHEITLNLGEGTIIEKEIYKGQIYNKGIIKINLKKGIITFDGLNFENSEIPSGYTETQNVIKIKKINLQDIKQGYKNGDIENWFEILRFFVDSQEIEYYDNGQISDKRIYVNGLENGPYVSYYKNGQIKFEGNYINGEIDGILTGYYENGNVHFKGININGLKNGYWVNFYKNGQIKEEGNFINGIPNGTLIGYFEDGNIQYIENGKSGKLDGRSIIYGDDGSYTEIDANDGIGIITTYDEKKNIKLKYGFVTNDNKNIIENGNYIYYFDNGKITEGNYINGKKNGSRTGYYEDGSIRFLGNFENGLGIMYYYDEYGNFIGTGEEFFDGYKNYTKNGLSISLYENGQIASMCNYLDGVKNGPCSTYYENGQIMEIGEYKNKKNQMFNTIGKRSYYDKIGNFIGTGETTCLTENENDLCVELNTTGYIFMYYPYYNIETINYIDGLIHYTTGYYENGNIQYIEINDFNEYHRTILRLDYYNNGQIEYEINYNDGKKYGERIKYFEDGSISEKGNYIDGNKDGYRIEYFDNGQIYSEGNYDNGKRVGVWNRYLGDGSIGVSKDYGGTEKNNNQ